MAGLRASVVAASCAVLLAALLAGCGDGGRPAATGAVEELLRQRAEAVLDRDEAAFLATVDPRAGALRRAERRAFRNLARMPLGAWTYRLRGPVPGDGDRAAAEVRLRYRLRGYDTADVRTDQELRLVRRGDRWYVAGAAAGSRPQLWDQGRMTVARGEHSLVLGVGQDPGRLRDLVAVADRAVPAVTRAWGGAWARRVVVLAPASQVRMAELLGAGTDAYQGIAAVTTGEVAPGGSGPADRVFVNPDAYDLLGDVGRQIVLTHETAHVATRADTSAATPLWLSEGFADWAGYRGLDHTPRQGAPELARRVTSGRVPERLPADGDFRSGAAPERVARAYEGAWLACRLIAERWGERRLRAVYRAVGAESRGGGVEGALRRELGVGRGEFVGEWRTYLRAQLG